LSILGFEPFGLQAGGLTITPQGPQELKFSVCLNILLFILLAMTCSAKLDILNYNVRYKTWLSTCCSSIISSSEKLGEPKFSFSSKFWFRMSLT